MRGVWYKVEGLTEARFVKTPGARSFRAAAEKCAADFFERGGWNADWPVTVVVVTALGAEVARYAVTQELTFVARVVLPSRKLT